MFLFKPHPRLLVSRLKWVSFVKKSSCKSCVSYHSKLYSHGRHLSSAILTSNKDLRTSQSWSTFIPLTSCMPSSGHILRHMLLQELRERSEIENIKMVPTGYVGISRTGSAVLALVVILHTNILTWERMESPEIEPIRLPIRNWIPQNAAYATSIRQPR